LLRDYDAVARSLGMTPKLDRQGQPIPLGQKESKGWIYVVWIGRGIGLFNNWALAQAMVWGFTGATHKKYPDLESALEGWAAGPLKLQGTWQIPSPRPAILTPSLQRVAHAHDPAAPAPSLPPEVSLSHLNPWNANGDDNDDDNNDNDNDEDDEWEYFHDAADPPATPSPPSSPTPRPQTQATPTTPSDRSPFIRGPDAFRFSSMLTEGTISPRTIDTPLISSPASQASPLRRAASQASSLRTPASQASPPGVHMLTHPTPSGQDIRSRIYYDRAERLLHPPDKTDPAASARKVYVVVRGDRPGIYFSSRFALEMCGVNPGIKVVKFKSLRLACWYFVQEYMADHVGVPML
ncbi:hypothetical protein C8Q70DRAFT_898990, partial [Cubamyces menziesii]